LELASAGAAGACLAGAENLPNKNACAFAKDAIHLKDRFELQWGEQTYYGQGSVTASYHLELKRLDIGGFPETRLYRTPNRTGEAITLQQLAQELKDQALRKN
jgi:hypothetical protein